MNEDRAPIGRRELVLGGMLAGASTLAFAMQPRARETAPSLALSDTIPRRFGPFGEIAPGGFVLPVAGPLTERTYIDLLTRLYQADGMPPVMLLIARGQPEDPGMSVHRPERCYRASGFGVEGRGAVALPKPFPAAAQAVRMTARREDRVEQVFFWTRVGTRFPTSAQEQRMMTIRENLAGVLPAGLLFRISLIGNDAPAAFAVLERFHGVLFASLGNAARATLLGQ